MIPNMQAVKSLPLLEAVSLVKNTTKKLDPIHIGARSTRITTGKYQWIYSLRIKKKFIVTK